MIAGFSLVPEAHGYIDPGAGSMLLEGIIGGIAALREDIFDSYSAAEFSAALSASARIVERKEVSRSGRTLFWYEK